MTDSFDCTIVALTDALNALKQFTPDERRRLERLAMGANRVLIGTESNLLNVLGAIEALSERKMDVTKLKQEEVAKRQHYRTAREDHLRRNKDCRTFEENYEAAQMAVVDLCRDKVLPVLTHAKEQISSLQLKNTDAISESKALQNRLDEVEDAKEQLHEQVADLAQEMEDMRINLSAYAVLVAEEAKKLATTEAYKHEFDNANARIKELEQEVRLLNSVTVETPNDRLELAISELEVAKNGWASALSNRETIQNQLDNTNDELEIVMEERTAVKLRNELLEAELMRLTDENGELKQIVGEDKKAINSLEDRVTTLYELSSDLPQQNEQLEQLKSELIHVKAKAHALETELQRRHEEHSKQIEVCHKQLAQHNENARRIQVEHRNELATTAHQTYDRAVAEVEREYAEREQRLMQSHAMERQRHDNDHKAEVAKLCKDIEDLKMHQVQLEESKILELKEYDGLLGHLNASDIQDALQKLQALKASQGGHSVELRDKLQSITNTLSDKFICLQEVASQTPVDTVGQKRLRLTLSVDAISNDMDSDMDSDLDSDSEINMDSGSESDSDDVSMSGQDVNETDLFLDSSNDVADIQAIKSESVLEKSEQELPLPEDGKCSSLVEVGGIVRYCKNDANSRTGRCKSSHSTNKPARQEELREKYLQQLRE